MSILQLRKYTLTIILILGSLLGCGPKTMEMAGTSQVAEAEDRDFTPDPETNELAGTSWELVSLNGKELIEGTAITLEFTGTYLGGQMGCNGYGGSPDSGKYISKGGGTFQLGDPFAVTVQLCAERCFVTKFVERCRKFKNNLVILISNGVKPLFPHRTFNTQRRFTDFVSNGYLTDHCRIADVSALFPIQIVSNQSQIRTCPYEQGNNI